MPRNTDSPEDKDRKRGGREHTPTCMVWTLLDTLRGRFDILAFAREFGTLGIIDHHVSRASSARGKDILLDGGGDEVLWCGDDFPGVFGGVDISWIVGKA